MGEITARGMMGGYVVYCDGIVFALIAGNEVYLKGDAVNIPRFEERGLKPFRPFDNQDMVMKYYQTPPEVYEDRDAMREWVGGAIAAGRRGAAKRKPKAAKRKPKKSTVRRRAS